jgi:hypothetical protein
VYILLWGIRVHRSLAFLRVEPTKVAGRMDCAGIPAQLSPLAEPPPGRTGIGLTVTGPLIFTFPLTALIDLQRRRRHCQCKLNWVGENASTHGAKAHGSEASCEGVIFHIWFLSRYQSARRVSYLATSMFPWVKILEEVQEYRVLWTPRYERLLERR